MSFGQYSGEPKPGKPSFPVKAKRLKYVFDDPTHVWANPRKSDGSGFEQDNARNQGANIYFKTSNDGTRVLYSYRDSYPIASLFTHKKKQVVLLRSGKPYSVTTAKHMHMGQNASRHIETRFTVPVVVAGYDGKPDAGYHAQNLADYVERINASILEFSKARASRRIEWAHKEASSLWIECRDYAKFFGLKLPKLPKLPLIDVDKMRVIKDREILADAKREAKRKAENAACEAKHATEVKAWEESGACKHLTLHSYSERYSCEQQTRRDEWEANKPALIAAWKSGTGKSNSLQLVGYDDYALLRVKLDEDSKLHNVETSQGVSVPVAGRAGATRLLSFLQACKADGRTYKANGHTEHIGNFTVSSFGPIGYGNSAEPNAVRDAVAITDEQWVLVAGCHRIRWSEVESIADAVWKALANDNDTEHPNTDEHLAACASCMMAHDKKLPD